MFRQKRSRALNRSSRGERRLNGGWVVFPLIFFFFSWWKEKRLCDLERVIDATCCEEQINARESPEKNRVTTEPDLSSLLVGARLSYPGLSCFQSLGAMGHGA